MLKTTLFRSNAQVVRADFDQKDLCDAYLLDHLRGAMSFNNKAFALVEHFDGKLEYAIIIENSLTLLSSQDFFDRLDIPSSI